MSGMSLGETISSLRKSKGISQEMLAEHSGISLRTIQRIETDATTPRPYTLKTLADALDVPVEQLSLLPTVAKDESDTSLEVQSALLQINFSALAGLLIPFSNILLPLLLWKRSSHITEVKSTGKRIIGFQILWTLAMLLFTFLIPVIQFGLLHSYVIGRFPPTVVMVYVFFLLLNLWFTLRNTWRLQQKDTAIYSFIPALF